MLKEIKNIRQITGETQRRWFAGDDMELVVHLNEDLSIRAFEIIYKHNSKEFVLVWGANSGFAHMSIDDGESRPGRHKMTPIYLADGAFDAQKIAEDFKRKSDGIEADIKNFVIGKLTEI